MKYFVCFLLLAIYITTFVEGKWQDGRKKGGPPSDKMKKKLEDRAKAAKERLEKIQLKATQREKVVGKNTMRTDKKGGEIMMVRQGQVIKMKIKGVVQRFNNGTEIEKFKMKDATFEILKDGEDNTTYGVNAGVLEVKAMLVNSANISIKIFIFKEAANVTGEDGNEYELVEGGAKVNIIIDWPEDAEVLDVQYAVQCGFENELAKRAKNLGSIRGKKGNKFGNINRNPSTFAVCPHAQLTFSPSFQSDNNEVQMADDYPKSEEVSEEKESILTIRFKGRKIFYDPTAEVGDDIGEEIDDSDSSGVYQSSNVLLTFIVMAFSLLKMMY